MSEIPMLCDALRLLRLERRRKQEDVARAIGIAPSQFSQYESGIAEPERELVERAAEAMGLKREAVAWTLGWLELTRGSAAAPGPGGTAADEARRERSRIAGDLGNWATAALLTFTERLDRTLVLYEDRRRAQLLWDWLSLEEPADRRALVIEDAEYHTWALAELLWKKSLEAAADDAGRAVHFGDLAVQVAERAPGEPEWQAGTRAQAHGHHGNALRVLGDHAQAEQAFEAARRNWSQGGDKCPELGGEARLLGFEASLRRDQRRFEEAERLLGRALAKDRGEETPFLLINKGRLLRDQGDLEGAVEALTRAEPLLLAVREREPRLVFAARSNLVDYLSLLERYQEAESRLPEAWELAGTAGELDRLRLVWVGGRVAAGSGRAAEGSAALEQVRRDFAAREMAYDAALASLELAAVYLEQGATGSVRDLVRELLPVFQSREIHLEAQAALRLFQQSVEQDRATVALVRHLVAYLHRARRNPGLRLASPAEAGSARDAGDGRKGSPPGSRRKGS
jgi:transcriptional regulator with XRE-family HTH domain